MNTSNTTVAYTSESLWNKRTSCDTISESSVSLCCSTETIFSIQGRETDLLRDTSDTEWCETDEEPAVEFEPVTEPEEEGLVDGDSSGNSDNEIISTKVIEVVVRDDGDLEFADSEQTASGGSDSEMDFYDYWNCAQCRAKNNNPLYRYCEKCFKVRKNFFPPRPKRKHKLDVRIDSDSIPRTLSQDSGVESANSQEVVAPDRTEPDRIEPDRTPPGRVEPAQSNRNSRLSDDPIPGRKTKRRAESADGSVKRARIESGSETDSETDPAADVKPLVKMVSDPALTVDGPSAADPKQKHDDNMCIMCYSEPKSGVFVHGRIAHICCCYRCARQVWARAKRCPVCNCKVSNVLRAVVM